MPDGNLLPVTQNGVYNNYTKYFWDLSFSQDADGKFKMNRYTSPEKMLESLYQKRKEDINRIDEVKSMQDMGYVFERDDYERTVYIKKEDKKSKKSESLLTYADNKEFLKRLNNAQKEIDEVIKKSDKQKEDFSGFYKKYFNDNGTYQ
jgi:hypothetical protein